MPRVCYGFASLPTGKCGEVNLHLVKTASTCIIPSLSSGPPMGSHAGCWSKMGHQHNFALSRNIVNIFSPMLTKDKCGYWDAVCFNFMVSYAAYIPDIW